MVSILNWDKIPKKMPVEDWKNISADSAPPGVYTPNMSDKDNKKWKAKLVGVKSGDPRVEIRKAFQWLNGKKWSDSKNYYSQTLIVIRLEEKNEPQILFSTNGKIAMSHEDMILLNRAIEEAKAVLISNLT